MTDISLQSLQPCPLGASRPSGVVGDQLFTLLFLEPGVYVMHLQDH